jgi:TonB family protein
MLLDLTVKSSVVLTVAWLGTVALRRHAAAVRHLVWLVAVAALAALPFFVVALPALHVRIPPPVAAVTDLVFRANARVEDKLAPVTSAPGEPLRSAPDSAARAFEFPWITAVWAAGTAAALLRLAIGMLLVIRLRRGSRVFEEGREVLREAAAQLQVGRKVRLCENARAGIPLTTGILRQTIYLPSEARQWSRERLRVVLLHELAHVKRHDTALQFAGRLVLCAYWFHPLAWVAAREIRKECEHAADDLVLAAGTRASEYAGHLLEVAAGFRMAPASVWAALSMARPSQLEGRVAAILDPKGRRNAASPAMATAAVLAALLGSAPLAAMRPQANSAVSATETGTKALLRSAVAARDQAALERAGAALAVERRYSEAAKFYRAALDLEVLRSGSTSPATARALIRLADVLRRLPGGLQSAEPVYRQALEIQESALGAHHPDLVLALAWLGRAAHARKDYGQAAALYQRALPLSSSPEEQGRIQWDLAILAIAQGNPSEAVTHLEAARELVDPRSADAATVFDLLAGVLPQVGRDEEARIARDQAWAIHASLLSAMSKLEDQGEGPVQRVGGGVQAPRVLVKVEPEYSEAAHAFRYQGTVVLAVEIGTDGRARNIRPLRRLGMGLDEKAVDAVLQWRFAPGMREGLPVPVAATIEVNFRFVQ